jgi:CheY-like chemotaxis protein
MCRTCTYPESDISTPSEAPGSRFRVLVADDNRDHAAVLADLLTLYGFETFLAHDGEEAVRMIGTHQPHAVVLDIAMPGVDGISVCNWVRQQPGGGDVTVIALTGWTRQSDMEAARTAGFDHYFIKPNGSEEMIALLLALRGDGESVFAG